MSGDAPDGTYSQITGAAHCFAFEKGERRDIPLDDISDVLKHENAFVWVSLRDPDDELITKLQEEFDLHELAVEDTRLAHQRPKLEAYGTSLFIVLKTAALDGDALRFGEMHLFVGPNFLLSIKHGQSIDEARVRQRCDDMATTMSKGPAFVLYALLDFVVDNYRPIIEKFEDRFDELEKNVFADSLDRLLIADVYKLKRNLLKLRNAALPVSNICTELMRLHEDIIPKELRAYFRDVQDHVAHLVTMADSMQDMLNSAMQVNLALVGVSQNDVVKRLAGWGAILAIPTVVFSLYGMNFRNMPELQWTYGYPMAVGVTIVGCVLVHRRLVRAGWI